MSSTFGRVDDRDVAVASFVLVAHFDDHAVERILCAPAGVALHEATRDEPVRVAESEGRVSSRLFHRRPTTVRADCMLPVDRLRFQTLARQHIRVTLDGLLRDLGVELDEVQRDASLRHTTIVGVG